MSSLSAFFSALVKDKESWQKEREERINTLRTSQNQAESVSSSSDIKLKEAQDLFAQAKLIRSGADRDLVQALKSVQDLQEKLAAAHDQFWALQTKLTGAQDQFRALYEAVKPIIAAVCRQEDFAQGLRGIIPVLSTLFFEFVKGGFYRCVNNVISFIRVATPDAPLQQIVDPSMTAEFVQRWDEVKVELGGLTDQILEQMDVLPAVPPAP